MVLSYLNIFFSFMEIYELLEDYDVNGLYYKF